MAMIENYIHSFMKDARESCDALQENETFSKEEYEKLVNILSNEENDLEFLK